ncbi:MAG: metal-binding protein, partial [Novosphingobium sp.]
AVALALALDVVGIGAPAWWLVGQSLSLLLALAHFTAGLPAAVQFMPAPDGMAFALISIGGLWLALWQGRVRMWGLAPAIAGVIWLAGQRPPDLLITGDGRHVGISLGRLGDLLVLRERGASMAEESLAEVAGAIRTTAFDDWPDARCSADFCALDIARAERTWRILVARRDDMVEERALAAACERVDIVIAARRLPGSCRPAYLKADKRLLARTGGIGIDFSDGRISTVAQGQGDHGWSIGETFRRSRTSSTGALIWKPSRFP